MFSRTTISILYFQTNLDGHFFEILMNLRKDARVMWLKSHRKRTVALDKHVRSHEVLDLTFAGLLKWDILGLRTREDTP